MLFKFGLSRALLLGVLGSYLTIKPRFEKQGLFGKAERS